ncbi:MAG: hypothetical protein DMD60_05105 [Gemmatimonadetes bacterium]|nr:MAG: hypothetical protein DMD60_05105 [Gemmatimonadota bacterium]
MSDAYEQRFRGGSRPLGKPVREYVYRDEAGTPLFRVMRYEPKDFRAHKFLGYKGQLPQWDTRLGDARLVLYHLPELRTAITAGVAPIYVCEGEKDVENVEGAGGVATTMPFGAGKWRDDYREHLRGAQHVIVIADVDGPAGNYAGERHAQAVATSLVRAGFLVQIRQPAV